MKASVVCLCLGLGIASLPSTAAGDPRGPVLIAGALTPTAGSYAAGAEGAEWLLPGGARVVASAGSEFRVVGKPQKLALGPRKDTPGYTVLLRSGALRVSVPAEGRSAVVVSAPRKTNVLVVSGTMSITASNERVAVANAEGETKIGVGSDSLRALPIGMMREIDSGAGAVRPLADSPSSLDTPGLAFSFGADATLGAMRWPSAAGVSGYRVEIRNEKGRVVGTRETREPSLDGGAFRLSPGKYVAKVAGIDPSGLEAARAAECPFRVVRVTVPERGFVDADGAVHFPPGRSLELANADGIEMTYGGGDYFVAAPKTLDLVRAEPRLVRFRLPGNPAEAKLWLVPRQVRARVEFGPAVPTWPRDSLEIRVRVEEANAPTQAQAQPIDVRARVLLGVEPVNVSFVRDGNVLRGVLPPQTGKGPWVVRVEVEDQSGAALGRDFIEVARR
jgi:hypothetical protein